MGKIGWGIIGCGNISGTHRNALEASEAAELVACCDIIEDKGKAFAEEANCKYYQRVEDILADDDIQAVSLCVPSGMHSEMAIMAAQAGKHILSEKPLDITLKKIDDMIAAAAAANVKLAGVFQRRTYESTRKIREAVKSGKLGKLVIGDCYQKYFRSHEYYASGDWRATWDLDGGGALMNQGVHGIDLIMHIMGPVKRVSAICRTLVRNIPVEDTAVAIVEYENGAVGVIEGTTSVTPGEGCKVEISGDNGTVGLMNDTITTWKIDGEEEEGEGDAEAEGTASDPLALAATGHVAHVNDLCDAIVNDHEPAIPGSEARRAVELIKAIYKSSREGGAPIDLPLSYVDDGPGI